MSSDNGTPTVLEPEILTPDQIIVPAVTCPRVSGSAWPGAPRSRPG